MTKDLSTCWRSDFPDAWVAPEARIGDGVSIGPGCIIHPDVEIGPGTEVGEHCVLGHRGPGAAGPLVIGERSVIRCFTVIYAASRFGGRLETGHHVVIREGTVAGENLRVGNFSDIEGDCAIGDYCRFHSYVHVGKGSRIGSFVWLYSLTTATNDPLPPSELAEPAVIEDGAVVCVGVTLMPGTRIGKGAFLTAGTVGSGTIPAGAVIAGPEGRVVSHVSQLIHFDSGTQHPWMRHLAGRFPDAAQPRLGRLLDEILATRHELPVAPL